MRRIFFQSILYLLNFLKFQLLNYTYLTIHNIRASL